ncbi:MAG: hypothetical protein Q8K89_04540, partial [Actinomycetota bacterium]|nr:hypothetical protein [Actinomycetota bacterium]
MAEKAIPARVAMPLALAAAAGCASSAVLPYVGLPIVAAATAALLAQGGFALAIGAVMTGAAVAVVMGPWDIVFALPGGLATVLAVRALRTRDVQPVGGVLGLVVVGAAAGTDALRAASAGQTLASSISDTAEASAKALSSILGGAASTEQIDAASKLLVHLWPSAYVQTAVFTVVFAIGAATWAARRSGLPLERVKPMAQLDLSAH